MQNEKKWNLWKVIGFRFFFVYFTLYNFPFPLTEIPFLSKVIQYYTHFWEVLIPWIGKTVLHIQNPIPTSHTGSGDRLFDYICVLCNFVLSVLFTLFWSFLDRKRSGHSKLYQGLRIYLRWVLGASMIGYGAFKVIQSQFPAPGPSRLVEPFGEASPMGLLWTFMGASYGYNLFTGLAEMLGGILLFVPGWTALGSLVCIAVLSNVFALNLFYDVPVKLYSFHLLIMAFFLLGPDLKSVFDFFILKKKVSLVQDPPLFHKKRLQLGFQLVFCLYFIAISLHRSYEAKNVKTAAAELRGVWQVSQFSMTNGHSHVNTEVEWKRMVIDYPGWISILPLKGSLREFKSQVNLKEKTITLEKVKDPNWKSVLKVSRPKSDVLNLEGMFDGQLVKITLSRVDEASFLLLNRGYHWINEFPLNR